MRVLYAILKDFCTMNLHHRRKAELLFLANLLIAAGNPAGHEFLAKAQALK